MIKSKLIEFINDSINLLNLFLVYIHNSSCDSVKNHKHVVHILYLLFRIKKGHEFNFLMKNFSQPSFISFLNIVNTNGQLFSYSNMLLPLPWRGC